MAARNSESDKTALLDYCQSDVVALARLLPGGQFLPKRKPSNWIRFCSPRTPRQSGEFTWRWTNLPSRQNAKPAGRVTGTHPKLVQQVMRHSSITLTMDTYGHLIPGQEADAVAKMKGMMEGPLLPMNEPDPVGEFANSPEKAQRICQQSGCESRQSSATTCDSEQESMAHEKSPATQEIACLGDDVQAGATQFSSSGGGTRTGGGIPRENVHSRFRWGFTGDNPGQTTLNSQLTKRSNPVAGRAVGFAAG